jgi:hypothetical protein
MSVQDHRAVPASEDALVRVDDVRLPQARVPKPKMINRTCRIYGVTLIIIEVLRTLWLWLGQDFPSPSVLALHSLIAIGGLLVACNQPVGRTIFLVAGAPVAIVWTIALPLLALVLPLFSLGMTGSQLLRSLASFAALAMLAGYLLCGIYLFAFRFWRTEV